MINHACNKILKLKSFINAFLEADRNVKWINLNIFSRHKYTNELDCNYRLKIFIYLLAFIF